MEDTQTEIIKYNLDGLDTIRRFHECPAQKRCIVGPMGSAKTTAAGVEVCYYLPKFCFEEYGINHTRWVVLRNTHQQLIDSTMDCYSEWFPNAKTSGQDGINWLLQYQAGYRVEVMFRACDRPQDIRKFKSLQITGYHIDESIEVHEDIKRMLKSRIGRFPKKSPIKFGIETTNPPDPEHPTYWQFRWDSVIPGPPPTKQPLDKHAGFWQPPYENSHNLPPNYYEDMRADYVDNPDWIDMYILGKPGVVARGKLVYANFQTKYHVAERPEGHIWGEPVLVWNKGKLYRGWDNSGNVPACVVLQIPSPLQPQVLKEFTTERMGIVDFTKWVKAECNLLWPDAEYEDWGDPAGEHQFSKKEGGFTSNAELMRDCGIHVRASEQNVTARVQAVDQQMARIDGLLIDPNCTRLINGFLGGYCYPEIGNTGRFAEQVEKNKFSHIHDALQYIMVKVFGNMLSAEPRQTVAIHEFDPIDWNRDPNYGKQQEVTVTGKDWRVF